MEEQQPTTPMPAQWVPQAAQVADSQYSIYYPPTVPAQPAYAPWPSGQPNAAPTSQPARMPKAQALSVTRKLKSALIAVSVMAFGALAALAAGHITGVTARQSGANNASGAGSTQQTVPSSSDNGGFFNQGPTSGASNGGFGVSPNAPGQQPFTSSSTS